MNTLKAWTAQNMSIAIPVYIFGSIAILLIIAWIIWYFRRRRRQKILLAEKDKDSRPNSIISYNKTGNEAIAMNNRATRRESQVLPFPNTDNVDTTPAILPVNEHLESNSISTANNDNRQNAPASSVNGVNPFVPTTTQTTGNAGTHRRGKSFGFTF